MDLIEVLLDLSIIKEVNFQGEKTEVLFIKESSCRRRIGNLELVMMTGNQGFVPNT